VRLLTTTKLSALTTAITTADSFYSDGKTIAFAARAARGRGLRRNPRSDQRDGRGFARRDRHHHGASVPSSLGGTKLTLSTGTAQDLVIGGTAGTLTALV